MQHSMDKTNSSGPVSVKALKGIQSGDCAVFSFFLRGSDIIRVASIPEARRDSSGSIVGYQRKSLKHHVREITRYIDFSQGPFPNAIVLAMSPCVCFRPSTGGTGSDDSVVPGWLDIPVSTDGTKSAWVIDGQQRTLALAESNSPDMLVPVTGFISDDPEAHRTHFLLINKAKPVASALANELLPLVNAPLPLSLAKNRIPSLLCEILNLDLRSPLHGMIRRSTTDRRAHPEAVVADTGMIEAIRTSMNSPHGCLYVCRNVATGELDHRMALSRLRTFWASVREVFPDAWGRPPSESRLMHGVGIKSMGIVMDHVLPHAIPEAEEAEAVADLAEVLARLRPYCAWTGGQWPLLGGLEWNHLQNTTGHVRLLANMLVRVCMGASS